MVDDRLYRDIHKQKFLNAEGYLTEYAKDTIKYYIDKGHRYFNPPMEFLLSSIAASENGYFYNSSLAGREDARKATVIELTDEENEEI